MSLGITSRLQPRRIDGARAAEIRRRLADVERKTLPTVEEAKAQNAAGRIRKVPSCDGCGCMKKGGLICVIGFVKRVENHAARFVIMPELSPGPGCLQAHAGMRDAPGNTCSGWS